MSNFLRRSIASLHTFPVEGNGNDQTLNIVGMEIPGDSLHTFPVEGNGNCQPILHPTHGLPSLHTFPVEGNGNEKPGHPLSEKCMNSLHTFPVEGNGNDCPITIARYTTPRYTLSRLKGMETAIKCSVIKFCVGLATHFPG